MQPYSAQVASFKYAENCTNPKLIKSSVSANIQTSVIETEV